MQKWEEFKHSLFVKDRISAFLYFFLAPKFSCLWTSAMEKSACLPAISSESDKSGIGIPHPCLQKAVVAAMHSPHSLVRSDD